MHDRWRAKNLALTVGRLEKPTSRKLELGNSKVRGLLIGLGRFEQPSRTPLIDGNDQHRMVSSADVLGTLVPLGLSWVFGSRIKLERLSGLFPPYHDRTTLFPAQPQQAASYVGFFGTHHRGGYVSPWVFKSYTGMVLTTLLDLFTLVSSCQASVCSALVCPLSASSSTIAILIYDHLITIGRSNLEEYLITKPYNHTRYRDLLCLVASKNLERILVPFKPLLCVLQQYRNYCALRSAPVFTSKLIVFCWSSRFTSFQEVRHSGPSIVLPLPLFFPVARIFFSFDNYNSQPTKFLSVVSFRKGVVYILA